MRKCVFLIEKKVRKGVVVGSIALISCCTLYEASARAQAGTNGKQPPTQAINSLEGQASKYQTLLKDEDISSEPEIRQALYDKWADATCTIKKLKLQQLLERDYTEEEGTAVYSNCRSRLEKQKSDLESDGSARPPTPSPTKPESRATPQLDKMVDATAGTCHLAEKYDRIDSKAHFTYVLQCNRGVTPSELAIVSQPGHAVLTNGEILSFQRDLEFKSYDEKTATSTFSLRSPSAMFEFDIPDSSISPKQASVVIASGAVSQASECKADGQPVGCFIQEITSFPTLLSDQEAGQPEGTEAETGQAKPSPAAPAGPASCPVDVVNETLDRPSITAIDHSAAPPAVSGKMPTSKTGDVQICVDGKVLGAPVPVQNDGSFKAALSPGLKDNQVIQAQFEKSLGGGTSPVWGPVSDKVQAGSCSKAASAGGVTPTLSISIDQNDMATYSGNVNGTNAGQIRICVNDLPNGQTATINSGKFKGVSGFKVSPGDQITVQVVTSTAGTTTYGPPSSIVSVKSGPAVVGNTDNAAGRNKALSVLIGGVEYSGYSSESQTTNGFLNIFYRGPLVGDGWRNGFTGWSRIRLTSAAQPATNGVVSVISNPTGLTTANYSNVGQVLDYVFGPTWNIPNTKYWSLIGGFGAITPLSSQNTPVTFVAPPPGTQECTTLVDRFSPKNGYHPGLALNTNPNPTTCLAGGYTDIAFSNQDRTNFLMKYGAGVRSVYPLQDCKTSSSNCSTAYAAIDGTLGQDSSVTGGYLRGVVFKLDGILPIPTGSSSWLYLFGSAYMRLQSNKNLAPLILQTPTPPIAVPSPTVVVLPLVQPNRDYYRLGVGLNINQLWCKAFGSGCATTPTNTGGDNPSPTITKLVPSTVKPGSPAFTLKVTGSNFISTSTIQWNGANLKTTFISSTEVDADILASFVSKAATVKVTVSNPTPGGGTSGVSSFTIK